MGLKKINHFGWLIELYFLCSYLFSSEVAFPSCSLKNLSNHVENLQENITAEELFAAAQRFLRRNHTNSMSGFETFHYGRSVSNQRIEAFWSQLRRLCTGWWIDFFKDVVQSGEYDLTLNIHRECLKFSFSQIIQTQLDIVKEYSL